MSMKRNSRSDRLIRKSNFLSNRPPHDMISKYNPKIIPLSNRSGQVASTLTWFVATFVVFFIMVLFTSASLLLAGERKVFGGFAKIEVQNAGDRFIPQEVLGSLLSKRVKLDEDGVEMRELIYTWAFEIEGEKKEELAKNIKKEVGKSLQLYEQDCYTLFLEHKSAPTSSLLVASNQFEENEVIFEEGERVEEVLQEAIKFVIYNSGKQINGRFYLGTC